MALVLLILLLPILASIALATRFGGPARVINLVDYSQIADAPAFNRWAGNRLLLLPALDAAGVLLALRRPDLGAPLLIALMLVMVVVFYWVAIGAARFTSTK